MSFFDFVNFLGEVNTCTGLPGIILFVLFYRKMDKTSSIVYLILLTSFLADSLNHIIIWVYKYHQVNSSFNSYIFSNTWILIDFYLVSWWTMSLIPRRKKLILFIVNFYTVVALVSFCFSYSFFESNTYTRSLWSISLVTFSLLLFIEILRSSTTKKLMNQPVFWVNTGIFLFASTSLFNYLSEQYLVFEMQITWVDYAPIQFFTVFFNIVKNLLVFYSFILVIKGHPNSIVSKDNSLT